MLLQRRKDAWIDQTARTGGVIDTDLSNASKNSFMVFWSDHGGVGCGAIELCAATALTGPRDLIELIRFALIPSQVAWILGIDQEEAIHLERYFQDLEGKYLGEMPSLISDTEELLARESISEDALDSYLARLNKAFEQCNPSYEFIVWGYLPAILHKVFDADLGLEEEFKSEEDLQADAAIKGLLDDGSFNQDDEEHFTLALSFLNSRQSGY